MGSLTQSYIVCKHIWLNIGLAVNKNINQLLRTMVQKTISWVRGCRWCPLCYWNARKVWLQVYSGRNMELWYLRFKRTYFLDIITVPFSYSTYLPVIFLLFCLVTHFASAKGMKRTVFNKPHTKHMSQNAFWTIFYTYLFCSFSTPILPVFHEKTSLTISYYNRS